MDYFLGALFFDGYTPQKTGDQYYRISPKGPQSLLSKTDGYPISYYWEHYTDSLRGFMSGEQRTETDTRTLMSLRK